MAENNLTGPTTAEVFKKTRRIEIRTSRLVNELFGGRYHSTFKGRGMEFSDIREYVPGDDVRSIHWKVTARLGHPYIKQFTEERELTILIAVDVSKSHRFGSKNKFKSELAAELVALLAFASLKNNDKVGLVLFSDKIEKYVPPRKSKRHTLALVRDILGFIPQNSQTNLDQALQYINRVQKKRAIVFVISDFLDENYEKSLSVVKRHHDTVAFIVEDRMEENWPNVGRVVLEDSENGMRQMMPIKLKDFQNDYRQRNRALREARDKMFAKIGMDRVKFKTNEDYIKPLLNFFKERERRFR